MSAAARRPRSARRPGRFDGARGRLAVLAAAGAAATLLAAQSARSESVLEDRPPPDSVEGMHGPLARMFEIRKREETLFPTLKRALQNLPPFFSDASVSLRPRSYFLRRRNLDNDVAEAWALGGSLFFESGWLGEAFAVGGEFYTSQKLVGVRERDGTLLLKPDQKGFSVLGQAYAMLRYRDHRFTAYRQDLNLPFVNGNDSRMAPRTFEGYTLRGAFAEIPKLEKIQYVGGYLTRTKPRDDDRFISMSEATGVPGTSSHGMAFGGFLISLSERFSIGAADYYVKDTINIAYAKFDHLFPMTGDLGVRLQGQFSHQRSVGSEALTGSSFRTWSVGGRLAASYRSAILALSFSTTDTGANIISPYGGSPSFLSIMQRDFDRAGEDAWMLTLTYNFERLGIAGLSAFANYAEGYGAIDADTGESLPDRREFDITLDYHPKTGALRGFWLRLRASVLDVDGRDKTSNVVRAIIRYEIPVL